MNVVGAGNIQRRSLEWYRELEWGEEEGRGGGEEEKRGIGGVESFGWMDGKGGRGSVGGVGGHGDGR